MLNVSGSYFFPVTGTPDPRVMVAIPWGYPMDHGAGDRGPGGDGGGTVGRMVLIAPTVLEWDLKAGCNHDDWTDIVHFNFFQLKQ